MKPFFRTALPTALVLALLSACGADDGTATDLAATEVFGPTMRPGDNCLRCHSQGTKENLEQNAPVWSAGGTVYARKDAERDKGVAGVNVKITDATSRVVELRTNEVGNFFTRTPLTKPYRVAIEYQGKTKEMPIEAPAGSCNACHSWPDPVGGAPGRIYVP